MTTEETEPHIERVMELIGIKFGLNDEAAFWFEGVWVCKYPCTKSKSKQLLIVAPRGRFYCAATELTGTASELLQHASQTDST